MRWKTESGKVVSSHSSACGASSLIAKLRIDSRSCSCSSVKMKCLREAWKSGLRTLSAVAAMWCGLLVLGAWAGGDGWPAAWLQTLTQRDAKVNSRATYFRREPDQ